MRASISLAFSPHLTVASVTQACASLRPGLVCLGPLARTAKRRSFWPPRHISDDKLRCSDRDDRFLFGTPYNLRMTTKKRHKGTPTGETGQEALYLKSLSERQVQVAIKMRDGETVTGWIEYFDDMMVRLTREGRPNLFIYKTQIRTITEGSVAGSKRSIHNDESAG